MVEILGVKIDKINKTKALNKASEFLNSNKQYKVFTPNPEMVVDAQKDEYFKKVLNSGDLNLCDGIGLSLISRIKRITGVDFMLEICKIAEENRIGIYLLGSNNNEVLKKTVENLQKQFNKLKIFGFHKGLDISFGNETMKQCNNEIIIYSKEENKQIIDCINSSNPDILFVAFGHNKQEKWIYENLDKMPSVKIAMGVGGAFDYISGNIKRAPCWMRKIGLEWMYRLIKQPKRIKRIFRATIIFFYYVRRQRKNNRNK